MAGIRQATKKDINAILPIWRQLVMYHADLDPSFKPTSDAVEIFRVFLKKLLKRRNAAVLVAEEEGKPVGFCTAYIENHPEFRSGRYGKIADFVVDESYRRRGIGNSLLEAAQRWLLDNGVGYCRTEAAIINPASTGFWHKAGFRERTAILEKNISETE
ncbi:MAG: GNAT family N-acetyltransferase [Planctomycetota bacterium]